MPRQEREKRLIAEYVVENFPPGQWVLNVPLGPVPQELIEMQGLARASAIVRPSRRRVDAVAWDATGYYVIEAKIRDPFEGIGRLIVYAEEAADSQDLPGYTDQVIIPRLVVPWVIDRDRAACLKHGIELVQFQPAWIVDYIKERQDYHTAASRAARDDKRRLRELLGVE